MSRKLAMLLALLPLLVWRAPAQAHCDPAQIRAQIDRAKEARDDFLTFEDLDAREGAAEICRYLSRLSVARAMAQEPGCAEEALRLDAYALRLYGDAERMRDAFVRRQRTRPGSALPLSSNFCLN